VQQKDRKEWEEDKLLEGKTKLKMAEHELKKGLKNELYLKR